MDPKLSILSKFNGKYLYKSIRFIILWLALPILLVIVFMFSVQYEKLIQLIITIKN